MFFMLVTLVGTLTPRGRHQRLLFRLSDEQDLQESFFLYYYNFF